MNFLQLPAVKVASAFAGGILFAHSFPSIPPLGLILVGAAFALLGCFFAVSSRHSARRTFLLRDALLLASVVSAGALFHLNDCASPESSSLYRLARGEISERRTAQSTKTRWITAVGSMRGWPDYSPSRVSFDFAVDSFLAGGRWEHGGGTLLASLRTTDDEDSVHWVRSLRPGRVYEISGTLAAPKREGNPGELDYAGYLKVRGVAGILRFREGDIRIRGAESGGTVLAPAARAMHEWANEKLDVLVGGDEGNLLKGLLLGYRSEISRPLQTAFVNAGVVHILAVSGFNVAIIAAIIFSLLDLFRLGSVPKGLITIVALIFYVMLVGASPSAVRAGIMASAVLIASFIPRRISPLNSVAAAALIILVADTFSLFDVSFLLSFAAVLGIVTMYRPIKESIVRVVPRLSSVPVASSVIDLCAVSFAAFIGTFPITAAYFSRVSIVSLAANLFVVPWSALVTVAGVALLAFAAMPLGLAGFFAASAHFLSSVLLEFVAAAGSVPFASVSITTFHAGWAVVFYAAACALLSAPRGAVPRRIMLTVLFAADAAFLLDLAIPSGRVMDPSRLSVAFLDVGQGDATVIRFPDGKAILIDAGPRSAGFDAGERAVLPFLRREGIDCLEAFILTHPHSDHLGGACSVIRALPVRRVVETGRVWDSQAYREFISTLDRLKIPRLQVRGGDTVDVTPLGRLFVLAPWGDFVPDSTGHSSGDVNNSSIVLKLQYGSTSLILSGDAGSEPEKGLAAAYGRFLAGDVLKVAHHGSVASSSDSYVRAVSPRHAVISVGLSNRFNNPSEVVVGRLMDAGAEVERTDLGGAAVFTSDGVSLTRIQWRK